ncbi:MAG TPA: hypothetical protein PLY97_11545, partial [Acidocella sp.]|nr:hypothetical protein [Acidocella sp.]
MAQVTLAQLTQVAGAPAPDAPNAITMDDINRVLRAPATQAPTLDHGFMGTYARIQNGFNSSFYAVPRVLGNALAAGSNDIGLTGLVNRVTGLPIIPTPAQEEATNAAVQTRFDAQPQGGIAGGAGRLLGLGLATLPAAEAGGGIIGSGLGYLGEAVPEAAPYLNGARNFLAGTAGRESSGAGGMLARGASRAAAGAIAGAGAAASLGGTLAGGAVPGAVLGGFGPALVRPLEMGGTLVRNALSPILDAGEGALTAAGRRVLASLTADGLTVSDALARMRELGPAATLADAGGTNVRGLGEVVAHSPGEGSNLAQKTLQGRMDEQGVRAHSAVTEATGETGAVHAQAEQLMAQRAAAARPLYDKALNQTVPLTPRLQELLATPDLQRAMKEGVATAQRNAVAAGEPFNPVDYLHPEPGAPISMKALDAAKQGIDDAVEAYRDPTTGKLNLDGKGRSINALRAAFVSHLDSANPDYAAARAAYAGPSQSLDAMNMGAKALNNQPDVTKAAIANLAPGDKKFFLNGFTSALQHKIATNPDGANVVRRIFNNSNIRANIEAAIGDPAAFAKFQAKMEAEATFAATRNQILAGS